jgi:TolB-like protein/Tfp pilus assembly protein PilF
MVGYSRLMGADEEGTIARQRAHREALIDPEIASHGGRIVKTMGDGLLVEFPSVVEAVNCAVAVQQGMAEREGDVPDERRIQYRVGINLGDIVIDGDDILGDGVNVAARLEGLAESGGICISDVVHQSIEGKLDLAFADMGAQQVKNIARPVRAFKVLLHGAAEASDRELSLSDKPSIAVLPFDNLSGDPEQEYFADGIAEDIITALSRFHWFLVIARNTTFTYKGKAVGVKQVANELGVQYVLEGSVRKAGNRVRITAQLIDAQTGSHVWAERYDRDLEDIFAMQDEITEAIAGTVAPSFMVAEVRRAERKTPESLDAWDYTMRGNWHLWRMGKADISEARRLFETACELDPSSAAAYSGLAHAWAAEVYYRPTKDTSHARDSAFQAAQRAVALDGNDAWAQAVLGLVYVFMRRLDDSASACRQALDLNPSLAFAEGVLAICQAFRGGYEEAVVHANRAERLSPRDPYRFVWYQARAHAALGIEQYEESATWAKKSIEAYPEFGGGWRILAASYGHLGRFEEAAAALQEVRRLYPVVTIESMRASHLSNRPEHVERYVDGLRKAGLTESTEAEVKTPSPSLTDKPAIAVLPFDNMSGDPEQEYFSDGMAEDLITDLSKISNLSVTARNSAFSFKGQMPEINDVVEKLGVAFVLEGSVRKMGERLRINAQLIDGADGRHIWAERYDGDMAEIFDFQDRIREEIVSALQVSLTPTDKALTARKSTDSVEAYDLFLKGRENFYRYTHEHTLEAVRYLEAALEIDPNFADAYGYLSFCHYLGWGLMWADFDDTLDRANDLAERGVALDGTSAFALARLGWIQAHLRRYDQAIENLEKAIALAPNNGEVYATFGQVLNYWGDPKRALEMLDKAFSLETFVPAIWEYQAGHSHMLLWQYDEALIRFNRALERAPKILPAHVHLACAYVELNRLDDAGGAIKAVLEIAPLYTVKVVANVFPYRINEDRNRILDSLRKAGLPEGFEVEDEPPPLPDKPSIAVLPFDNLSDDTEQEYFADGISEDIITALSKFRSFFVIARNSTFTYKGQAVDVTRVGKELGVRYVLEGSVRKSGDRLRTTAQLIDAQTGNHVWAERYDGSVADIFDLQDEITAQIVGALVPELDAAERARALRRPPEDVDTWVIFQRAMAHVDRFNAEDNARATALLRETIERDPGFVPAHAHLAVLRAQAARHGYASDQSAALDEAREYGLYAVSKDPNDAVAHLGLGIAAMFRGEGDVAIPEIETAIDLNPNFARAFVWLGFAYSWCRGGMPEIEIQYYDTALRLSPRDPWRWYCLMHKGSALRVLGRHEEAVALCQAACRFPETGFLPLLHLTIALVHAGRTDEARDVAAKLLQMRPELTITIFKRMLSTLCPITLEPVLFALREAGLPEGGEPEEGPPSLPDKPSIAVLPFENLSNDPEQEYFSDGMAEDLITDISNISGLFVIARNSSFAFKGQAIDVKEIAAKLGVQHILEGSVRKMGPKLRVNAQLIDAASGGHLWAARYDGDLEDIFQFQDDIREQIVSALQVSLTPTDKALTDRKPTDNVEAYDLLLKGRANLFDFGPSHLLEAVKNFEEAIKIDPNFSEAYGYLSWCYFVGWVHMRRGFDDGLDRAHELAEKGVALDGTSAIALAALGWVQRYFRRHDQAVANFEKAIALAPNNAQVYAAFGQVLNWLGNPERGLEMLEKAFSIDTLPPPNWEFYAGCSHLLLRQYDKALSRINRGIERGPKFIPAYPLLAWTCVEMGRLDDARDAIKTFLELAPQFTVKKAAERWPYRIDEDHNRFLDALRKAGLPEGGRPEEESLPIPDKPSIAVRPFDNLSGNPEQGYFADGMVEEIITALSKISGLFVIARNSTFAFKGQPKDVRELARELGVRYVLEGSVRGSGDRLRVAAQLIEAGSGNHLWAERYDRVIDDIFDLQDDITGEIVTALRVELTDGENAEVWRRGTRNIAAWRNATAAVEALLKYSAQGNAEARELAEAARQADPDYALAWAILGISHWYETRLAPGANSGAALDKAEECAQRAHALDPNNPWTIGLRTWVMLSHRRFDDAVETARAGVIFNPGSADCRAYLGFALTSAGDPAEGIEHYRQAIRLNPLHPIWYLPTMARTLDMMGQSDAALDALEAALARDPDNFPARLQAVTLLARSGKTDAARDAVSEVLRLVPYFSLGRVRDWLLNRDEDFVATFIDGLRQAGLPED